MLKLKIKGLVKICKKHQQLLIEGEQEGWVKRSPAFFIKVERGQYEYGYSFEEAACPICIKKE